MSEHTRIAAPVRPERFDEAPLPPIPEVSGPDADASTQYSHYRTTLSRHRTGLSEHRTDLSEYRTDLSGDRTELSMRRTGMSIQRTRMSADRTLMSVIRTALSLIGFGFTIYQTFEKLRQSGVIHHAAAPRNFGATLIVFGILLLIGGIWRHVQFSVGFRRLRDEMMRAGLVHGESGYPVSVTLIVAVLLLCLGILSILSISFSLSVLG
jgi:uncharacterized membrane protein YidH (DUF202 family)